jgi:hypothetical protein
MNKRKTAILTLPPVSNYGGILQNFALQQALTKLGVEPITLYRRHRVTFPQQIIGVLYRIYNIIRGRKQLRLTSKQKDYIYRESTLFKNRYINITEPLYSTSALRSKVKALNVSSVIVGSDQVWRPKYTPFIYNHYLDFIDSKSGIKKIAYAASFGVDTWEYSEAQTERCKELAKDFNNISVREKSGVKLCNEYLGAEAVQVLDPTMLLTKEDYLSIIDYSNVPKREGLFTYLLDDNKKKRNLVKEVEVALQIKEFKNQPKAFRGNKSTDIYDYIVPSVEGWIKAFDQADFVITDSFHGTVFSIIFNKPFLAIVNEQKGASRFISLLESLGLEDRLVNEDCIVEQTIFGKKIDYKSVNTKLNVLRNEGFDFLKQSTI